ncbi:MAG: helix-turn-helix domain-containing protein [Paenibacillaceae bacterium]|nr:helix-turn-helix domain-containing protein [Paenibacillaceae bacterium]
MINAIVVEDEYIVRIGFIAAMPWAEFGIRIVGEAANGRKAIELLERAEVDLLITDLSMPVMNGFDLMRHVREAYPHIRIVVLTCHEDFHYIRDAMRFGALDYIIKTEIEGDNMQEALRRIMARLRETQPAATAETAPPADEAVWSEADGQRLQRHIDRYLPLYFAVSDSERAALGEELRALAPPASELRKAMHYLLVEWSRTPGIGSLHEWSRQADRLQSADDWDKALGDIRLHLRKRLRLAHYPEDVVLRILQAKEMLAAELDARTTQSDLAERLRLSRGYFSRAFQDIVGVPFNDHLKAQRMNRAKLLLAQTAKPVADVAEECGFLDHRYFSRQFREETGLLPSEYRSRHGQG